MYTPAESALDATIHGNTLSSALRIACVPCIRVDKVLPAPSFELITIPSGTLQNGRTAAIKSQLLLLKR